MCVCVLCKCVCVHVYVVCDKHVERRCKTKQFVLIWDIYLVTTSLTCNNCTPVTVCLQYLQRLARAEVNKHLKLIWKIDFNSRPEWGIFDYRCLVYRQTFIALLCWLIFDWELNYAFIKNIKHPEKNSTAVTCVYHVDLI